MSFGIKRVTSGITPMGGLVIIIVIALVFSGITALITQLNSYDLRQIAIQANDTATDTNQILKAGQTGNRILAELRNVTETIEIQRQNQTNTLLPIFYKQFNETSQILNVTNSLQNVTDDMQQLITFLRQNFNESMLDATYHEYAITDEMYENMSVINEKLDNLTGVLGTNPFQ